ncbi:gluconeogenesis factor YvcK family protein [Meiothermus hypogaeus]|uniref:Putative gluconeogenesis factor n=2 Tax=Meiothermus hypogaeus TaxID=884155 RepID=A0A511QZZ1_9DEIN|nr:gluconeogenesis factor YvcK family protein [Meiothermus hypogaeus]RIH79559.1 Gluconeogenesis factor [Meiothermus hypogaeus]GEM82945.1 putative gluconeogenesis factor [Meiothermus hypogaeus NBRC 106114]GIW36495.1 MAG: putative gluconeogenesis factor [Meiothermus sp.]
MIWNKAKRPNLRTLTQGLRINPADDRFLSTLRWLLPGMRVKRYALLAALGMLCMFTGVVHLSWQTSFLPWFLQATRWAGYFSIPLWISGGLWLLGGLILFLTGLRWMNRSMLSAITDPGSVSKQVYIRRKLEAGPRIVALGGGTGLSRVLRGLKMETANITAVVAVTDDGGSTGRLRVSFGVPAVGDLVDCLAALSDTEGLPELMEYRFQRGDELKGHTFGNLMLVSLSELNNDFAKAMRQANQVLRLRGAVWPATFETARLWAEREDGTRVQGETALREKSGRIRKVGLAPIGVAAMPEAVHALRKADMIVLGPGSLYSSVIPSFLPRGIQVAIQQSPARLVYIVNIMSERGETEGMDAYDHFQAVVQHLGRQPNVVLVNNARIPENLLKRYRAEGQTPVRFNPKRFEGLGAQIVAEDFLEPGFAQHDPTRLVKALMSLR